MTRTARGTLLLPLLLGACAPAGPAATRSPAAAPVWSPDAGPGRYRNPVVFADYSDPDVVRVGDDFYMTSSSFGNFPGLPILHSRDLVHWTLVGHALRRHPDPAFDVPQHGNGVWAPSIRYRNGEFMIYYGDPDRGIFLVKTRDPRGEWDPPVLVKEAKGWIDPAPLWDDDGNAYLVHAFANSRAGIKSVLHVAPLSPDGTRVIGEDRMVFDGRANHPTIEGPKFYKRDGWYYIFAPAGGVSTGWQTVLRSRSVYGPYEDRIVLAQGSTDVNGPHQGAWVELENGESWFLHFHDREAYGRIVHLQPMAWKDGWPVMGSDPDGDGKGEPVAEYRVPDVGAAHPPRVPQTSDEFDAPRLGPQWHWSANPRAEWLSLSERPGSLRLRSQPMPAGAANLWPVPGLLLQMIPGPELQATTRLSFAGTAPGETAGLLVLGMDYAYLALRRTPEGVELVQARAVDAHQGSPEQVLASVPGAPAELFLRVAIENPEGHEAVCRFSYSTDGVRFRPLGEPFTARPGRWVGAKLGLFAVRPAGSPAGGHADFDHFRLAPVPASTATAR